MFLSNSLDGLRGEDRGVRPPFEDIIKEASLASDPDDEGEDSQEEDDWAHGVVSGHQFNVILTLTPCNMLWYHHTVLVTAH